MSWKATHKPNLKHHSTQPAFRFPSTLSNNQGAQHADACFESLMPPVPIFQHAQKNKVKRKGWHMDLFKKKEKIKETTLATGQHSFTSMLWGWRGSHWAWEETTGQPKPPRQSRHETPLFTKQVLPNQVQRCQDKELLCMPTAKLQLQRDFSAGYQVPAHQQCLWGL